VTLESPAFRHGECQLTTGEVYWKDSDLDRIAGIEVYNVNYSVYSKNLEEEKEEED
jgi:hypothetical protein